MGDVRTIVVLPEESENPSEAVVATVVITPDSIPGYLQAEFTAWEAGSDEAWSLIDEWETKKRPAMLPHP
ncbi:MAG: hypothetical protein M3Y56_11895 [Armatimonadota bacterium]|nr:hypothetical protein [Armatimonadota bacterium]